MTKNELIKAREERRKARVLIITEANRHSKALGLRQSPDYSLRRINQAVAVVRRNRLVPSAVLYAIADFVVDSYAPVIAGLDNDVHEVEREVFSERAENPVERIYFLKRQTLEVMAALEPLEAPLSDLANHRAMG